MTASSRRSDSNGGRPRKSRAPIDTSGGRATSEARFWEANWIVDESGVVPVLEQHLDSPIGRPQALTFKGLLVPMCLNGLSRFHQGHVTEVARTLNAFLPWQLRVVGIENWDPYQTYDRVDRRFNTLCRALGIGWSTIVDGVEVWVDAHWVTRRLVQASIKDCPIRSITRAIDGTDVETWGALRGDVETINLDGPAEEARDPDDEEAPPQRNNRRRRRARVLGVGKDGRRIYTPDREARAGWRSAKGNKPAGHYAGYELHPVAQVMDLRFSDGVSRLTFGPDVPSLITDFTLVPAGSHRGEAVVPEILAAKAGGEEIDEVLWDRGYSQLRPETTSHPLNQAGIAQTFQPTEHQRVRRPFSPYAILIEGQLFSSHMPEELQQTLPMPPRGATEEEVLRYEAAFNARARYRWQLHAGPDKDGVTRWKCPFCAGLLRSRSLPATMRKSRTAPLVSLPEGVRCCDGTVSVGPGELPHRQRLSPGTTAWRSSYHRREAVEGAIGGLKGGFVNIERKFVRVFGRVKIAMFLAFAVLGYNRDRIRSFSAKKAAEEARRSLPRRRAKRRTGTWGELLDRRGNGPDRTHDPP